MVNDHKTDYFKAAHKHRKPSVKVSVEPSVKGKAVGSFGKVKSSAKRLALIGEISYFYA
jgi:hypothetical protein